MARKTFTLSSQNNDFNIERFRTRLTAKFCVVFVALTQILTRLISMIVYNPTAIRARLPYFVSLPFYGLTAFIVCLEYFLFKKIGPKILNYAQIIDICLLTAFTAEFLTILSLALSGISHQGVTIERLDSLFAFTSFGWRTLFVMFLIQNWKLKIIPPAAATLMVTGFIVYYKPGGTAFVVVTGILQTTYLVMMLYFHDKIKWREVFTNVQQERWMQVNNFVLNNIPENIFILELGGGKVKFVSDYCRDFMKKLHVEERFLFQNIKELKRQLVEDESESPSNGLTTENPLINLENFDNLEELIENFQGIIQDTNLQEKQFLIYNGKLRIENHHTKSIEIKISFIQQHNKEYIVLIIRDTTQRDLLVTFEANNKYKDQLLASVSHELRAPLNGNINLVESAIGKKNVPEEIKEKLLVPALRSSKFLLHLINDILDMSQIKAQKLRLIFKPGKLFETLKDTMQLVELGARRKGVELSLVIDPEVEQKILCTDHIRLSQIVLNLLNNAIKFTQKGSIVLSATSAEDPGYVKISVQDSGIGMTKEDIKKLFSDYTHIEFRDRAEINPTGVGLGLSIAYSLAKLLGPEGQEEVITVDSIVNEGSTFSFIVENKEEEEDSKSSSASFERISDEIDPSESEKKRRFSKLSESFAHQRLLTIGSERAKKNCECPKILVVDDNPFNTMAFETVLASLNSKCDCVFDGRTAIDKILERKNTGCGENCRPYQVVFMDQEMPGMTGSETTRELRQLQKESKVAGMKIVGCTAHGSVNEVERFMEAGIDLCIHKPITAGELQKILGELEM